jgi:FAD/FMN-containing dehydrogenase/Fe-S oxidoreductase
MARLDQQRERIQDDLRGLVTGEVRCDDVFVRLFASDASVYEIAPLGVVRPHSAADVVACVQYAAEKQIPLHARGAGTGLAGASLGPGLVLDFSRHLCRIKYTGDDSVRVQPGLVLERLNHHLRRLGRVFGPDPANTEVTTLGSVIAVDGAGSHWLKYGSARHHVLSLQVVLADGHVLTAGREPLVDGASCDPDPRKRDLINRLVRLVRDHAGAIRNAQPKSAVNRGGYGLAEVLDDGHFHLARLLAGSEGTLALVTEASLRTQFLPRYRGVSLLLFDSLDCAARAVPEVLPHRPSACDLMDRRHLTLARETEVRFDLLVPRDIEAAMLVEMDGDRQVDVRERIHALADDICRRRRLAVETRQAFDPTEVDLFWRLARRITPARYRLKGPARPVPVVEDVAVPTELLPDFLVRMQNVLKRHEVVASLFAHAGQGQLHIQPFLNLGAADDVEKMRRLAAELYEEVFAAGGSIGAERASGLSRTPFLRRQYGPLYEVMRQVKALLDPQNLLNPGKVIGDDDDLLVRNLRPPVPAAGPAARPAPDPDERPPLRNLIELQLSWDPAQVADVVRSCNGCGDCRTQAPDARMCPMLRVAPSEEASPRAKANLIRGVLTGQLELGSLTTPEFKAIADLCFHCHMCAVECPARVDIPRLMAESKGAYVAAKGLRFSDAMFLRLDLLGKLGGMFPTLVNWALGNRQMRWFLEKTLGIAQGRKLPRVATRSFVRRAARRRLTRPTRRSGHKVAYFVDTYANYHDPQLAQALVAVLEHNGVAVYVPPEQKQAGMAAISVGALDFARRLAQHNVAVLAEAVRQGYHVVATEPAAALSLTREYPHLLDDDDCRLVAAHTSEACAYLWKMHTQGRLQLDFRPINATLGYHMPCRLKALGCGAPGEHLLRLIPGLSVHRIEEGCSGMAGTFGLKRENYRTSLRIGWGLITRLRHPDLQAGTTECSMCKIQMEQGTNKPTIHPIKLLALAYGLMPEIELGWVVPGKERIVS